MTRGLPETLQEALRYFADPDRALQFLAASRWPDGVGCPRCNSQWVSFNGCRRVWICKPCNRDFSVKLGTVFGGSPIGLDKWLPAVWILVNAKKRISSYELARGLAVTQKTAWFMLHRIRLALQDHSLEKNPRCVESEHS